MTHPRHQQLYLQSLQPFHVNTGTPYPCQQSELDFHTLPHLPHKNKAPFVKPIKATAEILWQNSTHRTIPESEKAAIARLQAAFLPALQGVGPDIAIKAFQDLDTVFFGRKLRGNVIITWVDSATNARFLRFFSASPFQTLGFTDRDTNRYFKERGQCRIVLNAQVLLDEGGGDESPMKIMLETLLHEMVHAFRFVRESIWRECLGWGKRGFWYDEWHDEHFGSRVWAVDERAKRTLGLSAVHPLEPYRCHHFLEELSVGGCNSDGDGRRVEVRRKLCLR